MPLTAVRHVRKMRGGAQSHLLEADDGHHYVVKFRNNPQHRRILVNEWISAVFLDYLKISSPAPALVRLTPGFLAENPEVSLTLGTRKVTVEPGWHFGSRYPGHPERTAVYDFLPDALLGQVVNLDDFRAILVFDKWVGNADGRQSVFFRAIVESAAARRPGFVTSMIDHGFAFDGPSWDFSDSPLQGLYARRLVYEPVRSLNDFQPWLDQVIHFPEEVLDCALKSVPPEWVEGEEDALERLLETLIERRRRVPDLIRAARDCRVSPFPNWTAQAPGS
jgi:hypothetical protein